MYDVILVTQKEYINPEKIDWYVENILTEDELVRAALVAKDLKVKRVAWDDANFDWGSTRFILFRAVWDYFHRFQEFKQWLTVVATKTQLINSYDIIRWNFDKHYLGDLQQLGINIPATQFLTQGQRLDLNALMQQNMWCEAILKPAIAGGARHTYHLTQANVFQYQDLFEQLIQQEAMLLQEFQHNILTKGEVSLILFGGEFSHAVLKRAKLGDFRVQDDFGGSVQDYLPSDDEIIFAKQAIACCDEIPIYARVDVMWDNNDVLCLGELELIEPELWFRKSAHAGELLAEAILKIGAF